MAGVSFDTITAQQGDNGAFSLASQKLAAISALRQETAPITFQISLDSNAPDFRNELRLIDGLLDALETFWIGDAVALRIVCPDGQADDIVSNVIKVPRLALTLVPESEVLEETGIRAAGLSPASRFVLVALSAAAHSGAPATLMMSTETFPIRPFSADDILNACAVIADAEGDDRVQAISTWRPIGLFAGELARAALTNLDLEAFGLRHGVAARLSPSALAYAKILQAGRDAELGFWSGRPAEMVSPPLFKTISALDWLRDSKAGWSPQPWKTPDQPHFVRIAGAAKLDAERVLPRLYATLHR